MAQKVFILLKSYGFFFDKGENHEKDTFALQCAFRPCMAVAPGRSLGEALSTFRVAVRATMAAR